MEIAMRSTVSILASALFLAATASAFASGQKIPPTYVGPQTLNTGFKSPHVTNTARLTYNNSAAAKAAYVTNTPRVTYNNNNVLTYNRHVSGRQTFKRLWT
jgi:hypothetical protein